MHYNYGPGVRGTTAQRPMRSTPCVIHADNTHSFVRSSFIVVALFIVFLFLISSHEHCWKKWLYGWGLNRLLIACSKPWVALLRSQWVKLFWIWLRQISSIVQEYNFGRIKHNYNIDASIFLMLKFVSPTNGVFTA